MIKVTIDKKVYEYSKPPMLQEIVADLKLENILAAKVNQRLRELTYILTSDAEIEFLDYTSSDAIRIYQTTLRFVIAKAFQKLYPDATIKFDYNVSRSILATVDNLQLTETVLNNIIKETQKIVDANYKIERRRIPVGQAARLYTSLGMKDKVEVLKYRTEEYVNLYECDGYFNYMFGYMLPISTLHSFPTRRSSDLGFLIQYPRAEEAGVIPPFVDEPVFGKALRRATAWGNLLGGRNIANINQLSSSKRSLVDFVNMCETKHNQQLNELGTIIEESSDEISLIAIAGPSSSGKTTFSNRLRVELKTRGIKPVMISIDDYYLGKDEAPKNPDGSPDLEHINALDVDLFNKHMSALVRGEEVQLPKFNFQIGKREEGNTLKLHKGEILIIEGIHALNNKLTSSVPNHQKFKIYIAPQTQLHIDNQNPISITDLRLIRRMVRDNQFRNSSAEDTFDMWPSVRNGEFKWIYPFQKEADFVFNSELTYEFGVMKEHALRELEKIDDNSRHFITANRLIKFLKYFIDIDKELVPVNSILREFIGGSSYE